MSTVNEDLIRNLYLKYAPNEDVDSKIEYIQNTYGDNQNLFVENFYNKYSPETDLSSKLEHINLKYPSTDIKKKEDTTEDFQIPAELSIESGVEPDNLSLPLTNERFADAAGVVDLSKSLDDVKGPSIIEERLKAEEDKVSYFENLDVPQLDSAKTSYDQRLIDINRDLYYGRNQGKDFIDATQAEKKSIEQDRDYATIVKGYKTKDYSMADEMFSAITKLDPNQADYPGVALMAREKYLEYEDGINSDYKEQIKDINWDDYTEVDFNGEERADVDKISKLSNNISSSIAEGEDVIRDIVYAKAFERAEQNSDIKSFEAKLREDQGLKDFYEETNTKAFDIFKSTNESSKEAESDLNQGVSKLNKMSAVKQDNAVETYKNSVNIYREQLKSQVAQGTLDADKASEMLNKFNVESFNTLDKIQNNLIKEFDFEVVSLSNIIENKYGDKMQSDYSDFLKSHNLSEEDKKELNSIYSRLQDDIKKEKFNRLKSREMTLGDLGLITSFGKSFNSTFARQLSGAGTFFNSKILTEIGDEMGTAFSVADEPLEEFSDYLNLPAVVKSIGRLGGSGAASIAVGAAIGSVSGGIGTIPSMALIATAGAMTETIDMAGNMEREVLAATGSKLKAERASEAVMQSQLGNLWTYSLDGLPFVGKALKFIPTKGLRIAAAGLGELPTEITQEVLQSAQEESIRESVDRGGKISAEGFSEKLSDPKFFKPIILEVAPGTVLFGGSARAATEYMTSKKANKIVKEVVNNLNLSSVDKNNEFIKQKIHASILSQGKNFTNTWLSTLQKNGNITEKQLYDFYTFSNNIDGFVRETKGLDLDDNQSNIYFALASKANELYDKASNVNDRVTKSELNERANALKKNAQDFLRDPKAGGTYVVVKNFNNSPLILSEEQALSFVNQYGPILTNKNSGIEMTVVNSDKVSGALKKVEDIQARYIPQENFDRALAILDPIASERRELTLDELTEVGEALGENGSNVLDIGDKVALLEQNAVDLYLDLSERKEEYLKEFETVEETTEDIAVEPEVIEETQEDVAVEPVEEESSGRSLLESRFGKTKMSEFDAAQKALSDISPDTKFVVLNEKQYREQMEESDSRESTSKGGFNLKTNTIYINADKADATTVAHEVFHAALLNALNMNEGSAMAVTKKLITSLSAKLDNLPTVKEYLNDFALNYEENIRDEEKLSELVGLLAKNYNSMNNESKSLIKRFIDKISEILGLTKDSRLRRELGQFAKIKDNKVVDLLNTIARKTTKGEVITTEDIEILEVQEQGESGQVGTFNGKGRQQKAPSIKDDTRAYAKFVVQKDLAIYKDQNFITNMYDFTNAGPKDIGGGIVLDLYGGKNYPALMMEKTGTKPGQVSNIAAFNTKENADSFIKNAIDGNANLFAPHTGTKSGSWQFQQNIFAELVEKLLDNNVITNEELIRSFNSGLKSDNGKKALKIFNKNNGTNLTNLNEFTDNPKKLVELLDIDNNYSPDLRKELNDKIAANKKVQKYLSVKNKTEFAELLEDPMNVGSKPFDLMGVIEFDNTTFESPSRPEKGDLDYHPSFAWTVKAKVIAIVQPTHFYQSTESTDSYTKFNNDGVVVSTKADLKDSKGISLRKLYKIALKDTRVYITNKYGKRVIEKGKAPFDGTFEDFQKSKFKSSNVSSSAGSIPKVATFKSDLKSKQKATPQNRKQKVNEDVELLYPTTRQQRSFNFTQEQVDKALSSDKKSVEVLSKGLKPKEGDKVGVRLNLNVLKSKEIPIQTVHKGTNSKYKEVNGTSGFFRGEAIDYAPAVTLKNAYFNTDQRGIYKIKNGITNKTPVASVDGEYRKVLLDNTSFDGVEIKFNPMGSNLFVNAENNKPIRFVEEATVVGFRVYGRGKIEYFTEENKPKPYTPEEPQTRKQKDTSRETKLKDIAEFSIQEGLSAKETRAYLISIGYSKEEINSGMFDAQKIWNKDGKKIIKWLDWAKRWTLSKRSFKSISMFKAEETMDANIAAELKQAMNNAKELNKAFNAIKDIKERDKAVSDANIFLTDEEARETTLWRTMPKNIVELLFTMRNHIDNLSQKLIDSGAINAEESMQTISNNIGAYMNRSFQVFDNKNWKETVSEEVVTAAKNHLKQAYYNSFSGIDKLNKDYKEGKISEEEFSKKQKKLLSKQKPVNFIMKDQEVSEEEALSIHVDQVVDQILTGKEVMGYINSSQLGAKDTTILRRKKNIPEPIRALMGEYKDPAYNYAISIMKVANLVERQNFLKNIRDSGMGVYLFEDKPGRKMPEGYKKIALEGSDAMSPLNGLYGPKELVEEFQREAIKLGKFEKVYEGYLKLVGSVKYAKTILSVGTHAKNVIGNLFFMAQNGYINPSDFNNAFSILKNDFMGKPNEKMEALMDEYIRAGIIGQGASIGEIKALFDTQDSFEKSLERRMDSETQNRLDNIKKGTNKVFKSAQDLYQYEDDMFKIVAYEQEKRDYSKILFNKKYENLTAQEQISVNNYIAEIVKNILPNYSRIGKLGKAMKAFPVAGTFISFQLEAYRTAGNTLSLISKELKGDVPGLDAEAKSRLRRKGAKRLLAFTSFYGFKYALLSTMGLALLPKGEEEDKDKVYPLLPYWNKNADIIITEFKDNGDFEYISFSSSDPYGSLFKTFNATARYANEGGQVADVLETIYGPFVEEDILLKTILNIRDNENSYGGKVWQKDDPLGEKIIKASEQVYKAFEPGTITSIKKIIKNDNSKVDEFIGQMTGFKPFTVNSTRQASYIFKDIYNEVAESKKRYNRLKYNKDKMTQEEINIDIKIAQKSVKREYERGIEIYNLLLSLGVSTKKIKNIMSDNNIIKDIQTEIIRGKIKDIKYDPIKSKKK